MCAHAAKLMRHLFFQDLLNVSNVVQNSSKLQLRYIPFQFIVAAVVLVWRKDLQRKHFLNFEITRASLQSYQYCF